jgi:hypothetical protein
MLLLLLLFVWKESNFESLKLLLTSSWGWDSGREGSILQEKKKMEIKTQLLTIVIVERVIIILRNGGLGNTCKYQFWTIAMPLLAMLGFKCHSLHTIIVLNNYYTTIIGIICNDKIAIALLPMHAMLILKR